MKLKIGYKIAFIVIIVIICNLFVLTYYQNRFYNDNHPKFIRKHTSKSSTNEDYVNTLLEKSNVPFIEISTILHSVSIDNISSNYNFQSNSAKHNVLNGFFINEFNELNLINCDQYCKCNGSLMNSSNNQYISIFNGYSNYESIFSSSFINEFYSNISSNKSCSVSLRIQPIDAFISSINHSKMLIVFTTSNQIDMTLLSLQYLKYSIVDDVDIVIIDDHSVDGTVGILRKFGYHVISKSSAKGLTDSWNIGYQLAVLLKYKAVILINNDVLVPIGALDIYKQELSKHAAVVPLTTPLGSGHNPLQNLVNIYNRSENEIDYLNNPRHAQVLQNVLYQDYFRKKLRLFMTKKSGGNESFESEPESIDDNDDVTVVESKFSNKNHFNGFCIGLNLNLTQSLMYDLKNSIFFDPKLIVVGQEDYLADVMNKYNISTVVSLHIYMYHFKSVTVRAASRKNSNYNFITSENVYDPVVNDSTLNVIDKKNRSFDSLNKKSYYSLVNGSDSRDKLSFYHPELFDVNSSSSESKGVNLYKNLLKLPHTKLYPASQLNVIIIAVVTSVSNVYSDTVISSMKQFYSNVVILIFTNENEWYCNTDEDELSTRSIDKFDIDILISFSPYFDLSKFYGDVRLPKVSSTLSSMVITKYKYVLAIAFVSDTTGSDVKMHDIHSRIFDVINENSFLEVDNLKEFAESNLSNISYSHIQDLSASSVEPINKRVDSIDNSNLKDYINTKKVVSLNTWISEGNLANYDRIIAYNSDIFGKLNSILKHMGLKYKCSMSCPHYSLMKVKDSRYLNESYSKSNDETTLESLTMANYYNFKMQLDIIDINLENVNYDEIGYRLSSILKQENFELIARPYNISSGDQVNTMETELTHKRLYADVNRIDNTNSFNKQGTEVSEKSVLSVDDICENIMSKINKIKFCIGIRSLLKDILQLEILLLSYVYQHLLKFFKNIEMQESNHIVMNIYVLNTENADNSLVYRILIDEINNRSIKIFKGYLSRYINKYQIIDNENDSSLSKNKSILKFLRCLELIIGKNNEMLKTFIPRVYFFQDQLSSTNHHLEQNQYFGYDMTDLLLEYLLYGHSGGLSDSRLKSDPKQMRKLYRRISKHLKSEIEIYSNNSIKWNDMTSCNCDWILFTNGDNMYNSEWFETIFPHLFNQNLVILGWDFVTHHRRKNVPHQVISISFSRQKLDLGSLCVRMSLYEVSNARFLPEGLFTNDLFARDFFTVNSLLQHVDDEVKETHLIHEVLMFHQ